MPIENRNNFFRETFYRKFRQVNIEKQLTLQIIKCLPDFAIASATKFFAPHNGVCYLIRLRIRWQVHRRQVQT